jgi:hypothetical protein
MQIRGHPITPKLHSASYPRKRKLLKTRVLAGCGSSSQAGIFCKSCGTTLRPIIPLIVPTAPQVSPKLPTWKRITAGNGASGGVLLAFSLCALFDFVWTLLAKRSFAEAAISAVT